MENLLKVEDALQDAAMILVNENSLLNSDPYKAAHVQFMLNHVPL